jgi:membrane protease subunit (stomatin/prohibitin family)
VGIFIEVIEWRQDDGRQLVHRFEGRGDIKRGAQLIVTENQWAVFFRDGRALDAFSAGRHTLHTQNIPLLVEAMKIPFGGDTPFKADVYFVSRKAHTNLRWGTRDPVVFRDPQFDMVRLRAHGRYAINVTDPRKMVNTLVGTLGRYSTEDIEDYLREIIVARLNDVLGEAGIPLLDLPRMYDELAEQLVERVADDFAGYGLALQNLVIGAVTPPEEVARVIDERAGMAVVGMRSSYVGYKAAQALGDAASGGGGGEGGAGGGSAAQGLGLGVGAGMGMAMPGIIGQGLKAGATEGASQAPAAGTGGDAPAEAAEAGFCSGCGAGLSDGARFCHRCGAKVARAACPDCGGELPGGAAFCPGCGKKLGG